MRIWDKEYILEDLLKENIISLDRGRVISSIDLAKYPGVFPVYSSSSQKNGLFGCYDKFDFDEELITWSVDGGGYFFYRPKHKFSVTNVSGVLKINKPELFDYKFLYYNLAFQHASQYYDYSDKAHPSVIKKQYLIPKIDLTEQKKIASILSKLDQAITQTEQLIEKYKKIKEGLMHDLLTRGIDEEGNIRSEKTHKFKDSPLGRIPVEWEVVDITRYTKNTDNAIKPGPFGSSIKKEFYTKRGYKVYGQEQVIANNPFIGNYYIDKKRYSFLYNFRVESGDVLLSCVGTIGNVLIIPDNYEEGIINPRLIKFSIDTTKTNIHFFAEYLKQSSINIQLINMANGGTMPVLNKNIILNLKFIYPNLKEQNRIQEKLDAISRHISVEIGNLIKLQLQKSGLMHDLLTGKVRVSNCEEQKEQTSNVNDDTLKTQTHNQHIEDAVLIGAIVNAFYSDKYTLGRKKIQKLLYLVRRHQEASVDCFKKKAAGPYADEVRYKGGEPIAKANKYIATKTTNLGTVFSKGENIEKALSYIEKWEILSDIDWLIAQFKYTKVDQLELIATIDMARCDLERDGIPVSLSTIKQLIATNEEWKEKLKKDYFDDFSIQRSIDESYKLFGE